MLKIKKLQLVPIFQKLKKKPTKNKCNQSQLKMNILNVIINKLAP